MKLGTGKKCILYCKYHDDLGRSLGGDHIYIFIYVYIYIVVFFPRSAAKEEQQTDVRMRAVCRS